MTNACQFLSYYLIPHLDDDYTLMKYGKEPPDREEDSLEYFAECISHWDWPPSLEDVKPTCVRWVLGGMRREDWV